MPLVFPHTPYQKPIEVSVRRLDDLEHFIEQHDVAYYCNYEYSLSLDERLLLPAIERLQPLENRCVINVSSLRIVGSGKSESVDGEEESKEAQYLYKQVMHDFAEGFTRSLLDLTTERGHLEGFPFVYPSLLLGLKHLEMDCTSDMVNDAFAMLFEVS